jgi:hypothetical protein
VQHDLGGLTHGSRTAAPVVDLQLQLPLDQSGREIELALVQDDGTAGGAGVPAAAGDQPCRAQEHSGRRSESRGRVGASAARQGPHHELTTTAKVSVADSVTPPTVPWTRNVSW